MKEDHQVSTPSSGLKKIIDGACLACGWALMGVIALMCFEVVARKMLNFSIQGVDEIGGYTIAVISCIGFAAALGYGEHVRIDLFIVRTGPSLRYWLDVLAYFVTAVVAISIAYHAYGVLEETLEFGSVATSPLQTPMWIPQSLWFGGLLLFAIVGVFTAWRVFRRGRVAD